MGKVPIVNQCKVTQSFRPTQEPIKGFIPRRIMTNITIGEGLIACLFSIEGLYPVWTEEFSVFTLFSSCKLFSATKSIYPSHHLAWELA
jgi:hypothetical protein